MKSKDRVRATVAAVRETVLRSLRGTRGRRIILASLIVAIVAGGLVDFFTTTRIVEISSTQDLDAYTGKIVIKYSRPVAHDNWSSPESGGDALNFESSYSDDGRTETIALAPPTKYHHQFHLTRRDPAADYRFLGLFRRPRPLTVTTGMEKVTVAELIPADGGAPVPETMNNQIVVKFCCNVIGKAQQGVNIPPADLKVARLSPVVQGYWRWSSENILTFNFTSDRPQFETKYTVDLFPEQLIDPEYQVWTDPKKTFGFTTSTNEVYVTAVTPHTDATWQDKLEIEFSGVMIDALDVLKKLKPGEVPVDLSPATAGTWTWTNAKTLQFEPDPEQGWPVRATMNVVIKPEINRDPDRKWRLGKEAARYTFKVKPREQSITAVSLAGEAVPLDNDLVVSFSRDMVPEGKLRVGFPPGPDAPVLLKPAVAGKFVWSQKDTLKFRPASLWPQLTEVEVALNPAFNPDPRFEWTGTHSAKFKTAEDVIRAEYFFLPEDDPSVGDFLRNESAYKAGGHLAPEGRLWIRFTPAVGQLLAKSLDLSQAVTVTPAVKGSYRWLSPALLEFLPETRWPEKTDFTVKITKAIMTRPDQHFTDKSDELKFTTDEDIVSVTPAGEQAAQPDAPFKVTFSKNVDPKLMIGREYHARELGKSPLRLDTKDDYTLTWEDQRTAVLKPGGRYFRPESAYPVVVDKALLPHPQTHFAAPPAPRFVTKKNLVDIAELTPEGRVSRNIVIDAAFTKKVREPELKNDAPVAPGMFTVEPKLPGTWTWLAEDRVQFKPEGPLTASTQYTVTFDPTKIKDPELTWARRDPGDDKKPAPAVFTFHTPALEVIDREARFDFNEKNLLQQRFHLDLTLSVPVLETDLRQHFSIWYEKPASDGTLVQVPLTYKLEAGAKEDGGIRKLTVTSDWIDRPPEDRRIFYKIAGKLKPTVGNLIMEDDYQSDFLQEAVKYVEITGVSFVYQDRAYRAFMRLSSPVDPDVLKKFLTVTDPAKKPVPYTLEIASTGEEGTFGIHIIGDFTPERKYVFQIARGLLATDGAYAAEAVEATAKPDTLASALDFDLPGSILAAQDLRLIPIRSVNMNAFKLSIYRVHPSNLRFFLNHAMSSDDVGPVSKLISEATYPVEPPPGTVLENQPIVTHLDLSKMFGENVRGLHQICLGDDCATHRWFLATDIGLIARRFGDNVVTWAHSLHSGQPLAGVRITVTDRWGQDIGSALTDADGTVRIALHDGDVPTVILADQGNDLSFLNLSVHRDRLADYAIDGIGAQETEVRSFIYSDRGVYRPGETVHFVAVTRARNGTLPPKDLPVIFTVTNPSGQEVVNERYKLSDQGLYVNDFVVPAGAKTGRWLATVRWDSRHGLDPASTYGFQVEEFVPNKIKVELELMTQKPAAGDTLRLKVHARNLFGPPAAGLSVSGSLSLRAAPFKPKGCEEFTFGHDETPFERIDAELAEDALDADGNHVYTYDIPSHIGSPTGLKAYVETTVLDDGGRGVAAYAETDVRLYRRYVGLKRLGRGRLTLGEEARFAAVAVDGDGVPSKRADQKLKFTVFRDKPITHYRKNERGYYRFVTETERILVAELGDPRDKDGNLGFKADAGGDYVLAVEDLVGGQITHVPFEVVDENEPSPLIADQDHVLLRAGMDKAEVGRTLRLEVQAPFPGRLLLIGEQDHILFTRVIAVTTAPKVVEIPVAADFLPNFYVSATLLRPVSQGGRNAPTFAVGLLNVNVTDPAQAPPYTLDVPTELKPRGPLPVKFSVPDAKGKTMYFTVAAVDEGILDLTQFKTPDMRDHFNRRQRLEVDHFDMYRSVMPYVPDVKRTITPSGDAAGEEPQKRRNVNPESQRRSKAMALWSGVLKLGDDGKGQATLDVPDFEGSLRVMVVGFGDQRFVSAAQTVTVRDKLVLKPSFPRFATTGDDFVIPVKVFNNTGADADVKVSADGSGHFTVLGATAKTATVKNGASTDLSFDLRVGHSLGTGELRIRAEGNGELTERRVELPVRSPGTLRVYTGSGTIDARSPRSLKLPQEYLAGTEALSLRVSDQRLEELEGSLAYLLTYPHGCLEQLTSRAMPLLHYEDLAAKAAPDVLAHGITAHDIVKTVIGRIEESQTESGRFRYWSTGDQVNDWASIYASHFLVEARAAGYEVGNSVWTGMLKGLNQFVSTAFGRGDIGDEDHGLSQRVYALYVLARAGQDVASPLNQIYDAFFDDLRDPDRALLAAAFKAAGQADLAKKVIAGIAVTGRLERYRTYGGSFRSSARDMAVLLAATVEVDPDANTIDPLADRLLEERGQSAAWGTTQENAWAVLALGKAFTRKTSEPRPKAKVVLPDQSTVMVDKEAALATPQLRGGEVRIEVEGQGRATYLWRSEGIDADPKSLQVDQGLVVRRRYLLADGEEVPARGVSQGDLITVEIKVRSSNGTVRNVAVTDLLPMGLEVENERLSTATKTTRARTTAAPDNLDIRDDRVNLYLTVSPQESTYYYTARAVTVGTFQVPMVAADAMYDPDTVSRADSGRLAVRKRK